MEQKILTTDDPWLRDLKDGTRGNTYINPPVDISISQSGINKDGKKRKQPWVSFGKLMLVCVGTPLRYKSFSEVQIIFYNINPKASFVRGWNLANFPILIDDFFKFYKAFRKKAGPTMTLVQFMDFMRRYFISNQGSPPYGLSSKQGPMQKTSSGYQRKKTVKDLTAVESQIKRALDQAYNSDTNPQSPSDRVPNK